MNGIETLFNILGLSNTVSQFKKGTEPFRNPEKFKKRRQDCFIDRARHGVCQKHRPQGHGAAPGQGTR